MKAKDIKELKEYLKDQIQMNYDDGENPDDISWPQQFGVLVSNKQAEFILESLSKAPEKEEEKVRLFKYEDANCHANIVTLKHGSYNCTECGAFMGTSWGSDTKVDRSKLTEINVNDLV